MGRPKGSWCGAANPRFNGGRRKSNGYILVQKPGHPNARKNGYVGEHVLVISEHLGRPILPGEVVHHKNGVKDDNRLENLEVMPRSKHHSIHHKGVRKPASLKNLRPMTSEWQKSIWDSGVKDSSRRKARVCDFCGNEFFKYRNISLNSQYKLKHQFCNAACFQSFRSAKAHAPSDSK